MQMGARPPSKIATQHGTRVPLPRSKHRISPVLHKRCPLVEYLLLARRKKLAQLGPCDPRAAAALPTHAHQAVAPQRVKTRTTTCEQEATHLARDAARFGLWGGNDCDRINHSRGT